MNILAKADICAVLLLNETSTVLFLHRLQNVVNISRFNVNHFILEERLIAIEANSGTKTDMCRKTMR